MLDDFFGLKVLSSHILNLPFGPRLTFNLDQFKPARSFGLKIPQELSRTAWDFQPLGYMKTHEAPVIVGNQNGDKEVRLMRFSLCPSWSKEYPFKPSSYNARMERPLEKFNKDTGKKDIARDPKTGEPAPEYIYQIPSWRDSFNSGKTCLVPITWAIESCHFGKSKGKDIKVAQESEEPYFAVGIWSEWTNKTSGEIYETFALITDDPYQYLFDNGHDRSIFIIPESEHDDWLFGQDMKPEFRFNFLRENRISLNWKSSVVRDLKKTHSYTEEELSYIKVWDGRF